MKTFIALVVLMISFSASAQWSNTTNQFFDSLHTPVSTALQSQDEPLVVRSYPDGGYFVIWQDSRNQSTTKSDIYAQKYDNDGNRLWAENGNPVTTGPNAQYYKYGGSQDYRNRSYAATDSAGGFYICYIDDSVASYSWPRIAVQHMRSNGSAVFGGAGFIAAAIPSTENYSFSNPTLIADGNKGFYLGFIQQPYSAYLRVLNYRDESGTMTYYGGGIVNQNAIQKFRLNSCGIQPYVEYPGLNVGDYHIWPDGQGGCNIVMSLSGNGSQGTMLGFNRLWRAKKDSKARTLYRNESGIACPQVTDYKKDNVYFLYQLKTHFTETRCGGSGGPLYVVTNIFVTSNGFHLIDQGAYDYNYPKGATLFTDGNINVDMVAVTRRSFVNNTVSDFTVQGYAYKVEKFDSIPYQRSSYDDPDFGYNRFEPPLDTFITFRDTLLASGNSYPDFSLAGGGSDFFAASLMSTTGTRQVRLQGIRLLNQSPHLYTFWHRAPKAGQVIGQELNTGVTGSNIYYDIPRITCSPSGNALFSIKESDRSIRISPIDGGTQLRWGAMGRAIGSAIFKNNFYNADQPVLAMDFDGNNGMITWRDNRNIPSASTGNNIYMRHLNTLNNVNHSPPRNPVRLVPNPFGATESNPCILYGTSHTFTPIEYSSTSFEPGTTTLAEIGDDFYVGRVRTYIYQHTSAAVRMFNGQPYLNRNLTIATEIAPTASSNIDMRFYFTTEEFNALRTADNSINTPGDLIIINQPYVPNSVPATYAPVAGEIRLSPTRWDSLPGGFFIGFSTPRFGNFFVMKSATTTVCPGSNTSISSNLTGTVYQWQLNTGTGFSDITADPHYSGINTATLQLLNIPSTWYGHKFRCLVNNIPSDVVALRFLANWTGTVSTDWNNPGNWGCGAVPDANTDVVINSSTVLLNTDGTCRTLTVKPGATFKINPGFNLIIMR